VTDAALLATFQAVGKEVSRTGLAPHGAGNLSVWTPDALIITAEGAMLVRLSAVDLVSVSRTTTPPAAHPAQDILIHRAIYVATGAKAVLHVHPPHAVALSFDRTEFTPPDLEGRHLVGSAPVVASRRNIVDSAAAAAERSPIVLVAGHGAYARGADLWECLRWVSVLEASARIAWLRAALPPTLVAQSTPNSSSRSSSMPK
jgi:L-fuculose-phosphate aldolase